MILWQWDSSSGNLELLTTTHICTHAHKNTQNLYELTVFNVLDMFMISISIPQLIFVNLSHQVCSFSLFDMLSFFRHALSHTLSVLPSLACSLACSLARSFFLPFSRSLAFSLVLSFPLSLSAHTHTRAHTHTNTLSLSLSLSHTHTHTHARTHV